LARPSVRLKAILVEKDEYAKELSRYIHLNPVRAKMVEQPEQYEWTSYRVSLHLLWLQNNVCAVAFFILVPKYLLIRSAAEVHV
jgi:hypothetical protein